MDISLVIPAYNERENLSQLVSACQNALDPFEGNHEIMLIDDGSSDGSRELIEELQKQEPRLNPIFHPPGQNIGCHPSELEGLKASRGDVVLFLPADLQIKPNVLPLFMAAAADADIVASHRVQRADHLIRRVLSNTNNKVEKIALGVKVNDAHSSMLFNRRSIDLIADSIQSDSALIPAEFLVRAKKLGLRIAEVDVPHFPRTAGAQTGASFLELVGVPIDLFRLRMKLRSKKNAALVATQSPSGNTYKATNSE